MPTKQTKARAIDQVVGSAIPGGELIASTTPTAGPAVPTQPGPTNLAVASNQIMFSAVTPLALVSLTWDAPPGIAVAGYIVEAATNSTFTTGLLRREAPQASVALELPTGVTYYFRVAAKTTFVISGWSNTASVTTATDTTAPAVPTSLSAVFNNAGDLEIAWVNPTSANFRDVEVSIYADAGFATLLFRAYDASQRLVWTAAQNRLAGSGTPDPAVFVRMASRSWAGVLSGNAVPSTQPVKAVPANVSSLTQSWSGDTGTASADLLITWATASGASFYRLTIDGTARDVFGLRYVYTFDQNAAEHSGTPDPVLSLSIVGVDGLDQVSGTPTTATATNAAPAAPASVTLTTFFSAMAIAVTTTQPVDIRTLRYRLIQTSPAAADVTWDSLSTLQTRTLSVNATYQVGVRMVDVFGQQGAETLSSASAIDALTLSDLRNEAIYTDSLGSSAATLAVMKDGTLGAGGVSYNANAGWVQWIQMRRELQERYRTITLAMTPASGTSTWYLRTSLDGVTWSYWAGPVTSSRILSGVASQASAQGAAISSATLGNSSNSRVDLPSVTEARYIEVWVRNTAASTRVDEFYPRRLVQGDDIEAESIRAINIAANSITADRLTVSQLSAIAADVGTVTFGGGIGVLSPAGITVEVPTSGDAVELNSYQLISAGAARAFLGGVYTSSSNFAALRVLPFASHAGEISIDAEAGSGGAYGQVVLRAANSANESSLIFRQTGAAGTLDFSPGSGATATVNINSAGTGNAGLQIGAGGSGNHLSIIDLIGDTTYTDYGLRIVREGSGANANNGIISRGTGILYMSATDAGSVEFYTSSTRRMQISATGGFGFFGAAAAARPTVTGSRGGNAALASLLTGLASLGLIVDSSS